MNILEWLKSVVTRYRQEGYQVVLYPGPDVLPSFAQEFRVEILATRRDEGVLVTAKDGSAFRADTDLANYAEIIAQQPGWRYDLYVFNPPAAAPDRSDVRDSSQGEIDLALIDAERLAAAGFLAQAVLASWAALEAAMRY